MYFQFLLLEFHRSPIFLLLSKIFKKRLFLKQNNFSANLHIIILVNLVLHVELFSDNFNKWMNCESGLHSSIKKNWNDFNSWRSWKVNTRGVIYFYCKKSRSWCKSLVWWKIDEENAHISREGHSHLHKVNAWTLILGNANIILFIFL